MKIWQLTVLVRKVYWIFLHILFLRNWLYMYLLKAMVLLSLNAHSILHINVRRFTSLFVKLQLVNKILSSFGKDR